MNSSNHPHPAESMIHTSVKLEKVAFCAYHGVHDVEKKVGRDFLVSLEVWYDWIDAAKNNDLTKTVDYAVLFDLTKKQMLETESLLETVIYKLYQAILAAYPNSSRILIEIEKLAPFIGGKCEASVVKLDITQTAE